eukprot:PRCOL_00002236-RA
MWEGLRVRALFARGGGFGVGGAGRRKAGGGAGARPAPSAARPGHVARRAGAGRAASEAGADHGGAIEEYARERRRESTQKLAQAATTLCAGGALLGVTETFWGGYGLGGALVVAHALAWLADGTSRLAQQPAGGLSVVVTGASRGLGKALAREFALRGDTVVIVSRTRESLKAAVAELRALEDVDAGAIYGLCCDVANPTDVEALARAVKARVRRVDVWVNNAGFNPGNKPLLQCTGKELAGVSGTNLLGAMLCTKAAAELMRDQEGGGGHVFNLTGRGGDGSASPGTAAYGATKAGMMQLKKTLVNEIHAAGLAERVGIHSVSPGMVLTDLLLRDTTPEMRQAFNVICEQPETVARALVPRIREARAPSSHIAYLTPFRIAGAILGAWARRGRWFDAEGRRIYKSEAERLKRWERRSASGVLRADWRPRGFDAASDALPAPAWAWLFATSVASCFVALSYDGDASSGSVVAATVTQALGAAMEAIEHTL